MLQLILALTRVCSHLREQEVFTTNSSSWVQPPSLAYWRADKSS